MLVVVAHGEEDEEHEQVLEDADDLDVGIGHFPVENVAAQAAEHPRVGRDGGDEVTASVDEGREFALPSQQEDDGQRQEAVEKAKKGRLSKSVRMGRTQKLSRVRDVMMTMMLKRMSQFDWSGVSQLRLLATYPAIMGRMMSVKI